MVSDHAWSRKGPDHGVGVDPETVNAEPLACRSASAKIRSHSGRPNQRKVNS